MSTLTIGSNSYARESSPPPNSSLLPPVSVTFKRNSVTRFTNSTKCMVSPSPAFKMSQLTSSPPPSHSVLTTQKVLRAAQALNIPIYATTQNRARLGDTVEDLQQHLSGPLCRVTADKTRFSMWIPEVVSQLPSGGAETGGNPADIVLVGIESHICITQTALDALAAGHRVYVLADGVSSCNREEVPLALARLRAEGATVTTSESWLYEVVGDAGLPEFKSVIAIVKDTLQDTKKVLAALAPAQGGSRI